MQVPCDQCGTILKRKPSHVQPHNFCNRKCYAAWYSQYREGKRLVEYVTKTCQGCGNTFEVRPHRGEIANYCSKECRRRRVIRPCAACGKPVERAQSEVDKMPHSFCDRTCYGKWRKTLTGESSPRWNGGPASLLCVQCGKTYERKHKDVKRLGSRFCSYECFGMWRSENVRGENHPHWQGGAISDKYYGPEWPTIREAIRQRDNHTCQRCGLHQDDHFKALDVHHIIPLREFLPDRIEEAHGVSNLITLCSSCHKTIHNLSTRP